MSGSIQGPGTQPPVDYSGASAGKSAEAGKAAVGSGMINGNAKLQMMHAEKAVTRSQLEHRPTLLKPEAMSTKAQVAASQAASEDLTGIGKATKAASDTVGGTMMRAQLGMQQVPGDQQWLMRNADNLQGAANYLKSLQNGEDKELLLGGQGFDDQQIEDLLMSQSDRAAFTNKVKAKYGDAYNQKKADLIAMGYDDHQADMILSLGDDNLMRNDLRKAEIKKIFKDSPEGQKLAELGFDEKKIKQLLALINKGAKPEGSMIDNQQLKNLLAKMGFSGKEGENAAAILLATGSPEKQKEQLMLMNKLKNNPQMLEQLESLANKAASLASAPNKPHLEEHLKQLADIFMVLELIHQMSVEQRRFAREARSMEYDAAKAEVLKQAEHIKKAALFTLVADGLQSVTTIAGGMASMRAGMKGAGSMRSPKGGTKSKVDDVQVSSPGKRKSGKKAKQNSNAAAKRGGVEQTSTNRQQNKANQKQAKDAENNAKKADQKKAERESDAQIQDANQRKQNKEVVIDKQNKEAANNQRAKNDSNKRQENSNETMANSNKGMMATQLSNAFGTMLASPFKFLASREQALQKESEAHQKTHENAAQSWSEWMQLQQDQVKNCQSKIDEINRIHFDTLKSLSRG